MVYDCDTFKYALEGISTAGDPHHLAVSSCLFVSVITFVASTLTRNYSQTDKVWSVVPFLYTWMAVCDARTLVMAIVATIWGFRLTWNFNRRGGYKWPPWDGDEDYRWQFLQDGALLETLKNKFAWAVFNLTFISFYQNVLLLLISTPSFVAWSAAKSPECLDSFTPWGSIDSVATVLFLLFVTLESVADNQQWAFQKEKKRRLALGEELVGEYADGFCQSGCFAIVRKPNYAAEQAIWISFYLYSVSATGGYWLNYSSVGSVLLVLLFQGSGWFTENITLTRHPKYTQYQKRVPLYIPNPLLLLRTSSFRERKKCIGKEN